MANNIFSYFKISGFPFRDCWTPAAADDATRRRMVHVNAHTLDVDDPWESAAGPVDYGISMAEDQRWYSWDPMEPVTPFDFILPVIVTANS